jgi:hypothetical protein
MRFDYAIKCFKGEQKATRNTAESEKLPPEQGEKVGEPQPVGWCSQSHSFNIMNPEIEYLKN